MVSDKVGILYFGGCVQCGFWHSVFWWLCTNSLEVGSLYFDGFVPTVWKLALCILVVVCQQFRV